MVEQWLTNRAVSPLDGKLLGYEESRIGKPSLRCRLGQRICHLIFKHSYSATVTLGLGSVASENDHFQTHCDDDANARQAVSTLSVLEISTCRDELIIGVSNGNTSH